MDREISVSASESEQERIIAGCLWGTAIGDAIGLPAEGLSRERQRRMFGAITGHRLLFGRGMVSDDTEHTLLVASALTQSAGEPKAFANALARGLRGWLLLVPAGAGLATVRATLRLLVGVPPSRSGVWSAGNGPAMRSALLGVCFGENPVRLRELVRACTCITHTDPKAEYGALTVAVAAHLSAAQCLIPERLVSELCTLLPEDDSARELLTLLRKAADSATRDETTAQFAESLGLGAGVGGYVYHTVPAAIHACLRHPSDFRRAVEGVIVCGGDTDTTAAIVGAIIGANVGEEGIPAAWRNGLIDWPRTPAFYHRLARQLSEVCATGKPSRPPSPLWPLLGFRNAGFLGVVLFHGFRRLLPPY